MAFCEKCGKEIGPDGMCDCQKASAEPAAGAAPTALAAPNNNKLIGIIAVAAVAVVLLVLVFALAGSGGSYKTPFKDFQKLINKQSTDIFAYQKVISDPMSAKFVKTFYGIAKGNDEVKEGLEELQEELKEFYDDLKGFKITKIEIKKPEKMKGSDLRSIKDRYKDYEEIYERISEELEDMDSGDYEDLAEELEISKSAAKKLVKAIKSYYQSLYKAKVQEGYDVQVIVHAKYDGETDKTERIDVRVLKINGKWYIYNAGSFMRDIEFDKDLKDVDIYPLYGLFGGNLANVFSSMSGF